LISLRNQPPAETLLEPANSGLMPNSAMASCQSSMPPPKYSQPMISLAMRPKGIEPK
jgi:hypothetical protein